MTFKIKIKFDFYVGYDGPTLRIAAECANQCMEFRSAIESVSFTQFEETQIIMASDDKAITILCSLDSVVAVDEFRQVSALVFQWSQCREGWRYTLNQIDMLLLVGSGHQYLTASSKKEPLVLLTLNEETAIP